MVRPEVQPEALNDREESTCLQTDVSYTHSVSCVTDSPPLCVFCRALEANHYNHVTATYFLLAERILREKQEKQSPSPSLVYNLAQQVQSRQVFSCPLRA